MSLSNLHWADDWVTGEEESADEWFLSFPITGERPHSLFIKEYDYMPQPDYISRYLSSSLDLTARQDAINWILQVSEFYRFRPVTVYLSVNYLDRFLSANALPVISKTTQGKKWGKDYAGEDWPMQLLSVACLSVAAKMEETHVPLLLDLQILNPKFVFQTRTVCRMELLLMSALRWRMRAVTPLDFIPYLVGGCGTALLSPAFFARSADLILCTHRVIDFLGFRPSVIAAAAVLCAASDVINSSAKYRLLNIFEDWISKDVVNQCRQLMEEYLIDTCPTYRSNAAAMPDVQPQSPVGVLDAAACESCDTPRLPVANTGGNEILPSKRPRFAESI